MPRATNNPATRRRRNKILKAAKGYHGGRRRLLKRATETVEKAWANAYRDRRRKKREYRRLWIVRINAAARLCGMSYNQLIDGLNRADVAIDRKILADLAVSDTAAFARVVDIAKEACAA